MISGCGYVGSALGLLLTAQGHTTFGLRRNTTALPPAILPVQADLSASLPPDALPPNLDAVVYAASPAGATDEAHRAKGHAVVHEYHHGGDHGGTSDTAAEEVTGLGSRDVRPGSRSVSGWRALSRSGLPDLPARGHHPDSYGIGSGKAVRVEADSGDSISILLYVLGDVGSGRGVFNYVSPALYPQYVSSMSVGV